MPRRCHVERSRSRGFGTVPMGRETLAKSSFNPHTTQSKTTPTTPRFHYSTIPLLHYPIIPLFHYCTTPPPHQSLTLLLIFYLPTSSSATPEKPTAAKARHSPKHLLPAAVYCA